MQLVGCTPTSGLWGLWNKHFTVLFVTAGQQSFTDSAESLRRAPVACSIHFCPFGVLLRTHHCTVDLWSVQAWKYFMFIQPHFCLGVSQVSVHIFTCRCVFVISLPLFLHLFLTDKLQADWIGYTLLFLLHHPTPALVSLFATCSPVQWNKSTPWNGLTSPCSLCVLFLLCWVFWKKFWVRFLFLYQFLLLSGLSKGILVWHHS